MVAERTIEPASLRSHYRSFLAPGRILLTGHSHQAWPDVARAAQLEAFDDAARFVDHKWGPAFEAAEAVRRAVATRIGAAAEEIALAANTHELVTRFLSALDLRARPKLVTTAGEFHTIHRQLRRLAEAGVEIIFEPVGDVTSLARRLGAHIDRRTAAVLVSSVLFESSQRVPDLDLLAATAREQGAEILVDAYHAFSVLPFSIAELGAHVFVVAGGYKYAQWGEGNCFLRVPASFAGRPIYTGWFSDFAHLSGDRMAPIGYGDRPADRFAGSTYDPTSHYRARAVAKFFDDEGLTIPALRACSERQTERIVRGLEGYDVATPRDVARRAGFVAVRVADADAVVSELAARGVMTDSRGDYLRFGPAPYLLDDEIDQGVATFRSIRSPG